jgi:5-methyltetrahydrofolate--homocysteine methyltransferase
MTHLFGSHSSVDFGPGKPVLLINDQLRVYDQAPQVLDELMAGRCDMVVQLARDGAAAGCQAVDILIDHPALTEADVLPRVVQAVDAAVGCPISLDSRNPLAIERALDGYPGKALLNSITGERELLDALLPLVAKYRLAVIALLTNDVHVPQTWQERLAVARAILARTDDAGIARTDVVFDAVCMAASTLSGSFQVTLDTLAAIHGELGMSTILGIGNAGFGMPDQTRLDLAYLVAAVPWGLDAALVDYHTENLLVAARAIDFLSGRDPAGGSYIGLYRPTRPRRTRTS